MIFEEVRTRKNLKQIYRYWVAGRQETSVLLDSSLYDAALGRYSIMGFEPRALLRSRGRNIEYRENGRGWQRWQGNPLAALDAVCRELPRLSPQQPSLPFSGGLIGYLSYDLKDQVEILPSAAHDDTGVYDQYWGIYDSGLVQDHLRGKIYFFACDRETAARRWQSISPALFHDTSPSDWCRLGPVAANFTREAYLAAIDEVREYIRRGIIYQVNLSQRFSAPLEGSSYHFYHTLSAVSPAYFGAFLRFAEYDILSISPERFIRIEGDGIETRPIKGTRPRGSTEEEDRELARELQDSEKDRAELLMIVDLERNDLGRIAQTGSVQVDNLFRIKAYATLFHLDATVRARLKGVKNWEGILRATFPGGSITGAPKIKAMEIIEKLEPVKRGVYTGSIGYLDRWGDGDLNIAIRTALVKDGTIHYQAGGGLVWDSDPQLEYDETLVKAKAFLEARKVVNRHADLVQRRV